MMENTGVELPPARPSDAPQIELKLLKYGDL